MLHVVTNGKCDREGIEKQQEVIHSNKFLENETATKNDKRASYRYYSSSFSIFYSINIVITTSEINK